MLHFVLDAVMHAFIDTALRYAHLHHICCTGLQQTACACKIHLAGLHQSFVKLS